MNNRELALTMTEAANDEYEDERKKGLGHSISISIIERRWKFKPGRLRDYRANYISRPRTSQQNKGS